MYITFKTKMILKLNLKYYKINLKKLQRIHFYKFVN